MHTKIGYARISTLEQESENQIIQLKKNGIEVIFSDEGISGTKPAKERPEFKRMLNYIKEHPEVKMIMVTELSRIGRSMDDVLTNFMELEKKNINIYSISEPWTQMSDMTLRPLLVSVISWVAEQELVTLKTRIKAGIERARKEGKQIGNKTKNIDEKFVEKMRSEGTSWAKIAISLNIDISTLNRRRQTWKENKLGRST
jgi:DNA invertase Pin-like site-specific DNA recombinase